MNQRSESQQNLSEKGGARHSKRGLWVMSLAICLSWAVGASQAVAQDVACDNSQEFPCSYQSEALELQKVPAIFKFQSRISQAKLPLGEAVFDAVFVKVLRGTETVCQEQFANVTVQGSVMNLEIGRNMSCELDEVIAENPSLAFQVCLGNQSNCLRPLDLAAAPYAVKSSFASQAQNAHKADLAGQAHYAHRVTADRDLLLRNKLGTGYFDFYTHPAESVEALYNAEDYMDFVNSGFIQWTPLNAEAAFAVHIVAKDPQTDQLRMLDTFVVGANESILRGHLRVTQGGMDITGDANIEGDTSIAGLLLMGHDPTNLLGFIDRNTHGVDGPLQITGQTLINSGGVHVIGDSDVQGRLAVGGVEPGYSLDVSGDINFTGQLRRDGEILAVSGAQWDGGDNGALYYDQGNVGVGTASPAFMMDVNGDINYTGQLRRNGQAVPVSPWSDNGDHISYAGQVQADNFQAGQGSLFNDLQIGEDGTGLGRDVTELRGQGQAQGLTLYGGGQANAVLSDAGDLTLRGSGNFLNLSATGGQFSGALTADSVTVTNNLNALSGQFTGALMADTLTLTNGLSATTGQFAGDLSGVNATFTGALSTDTLTVTDSVELNHLNVPVEGDITLNSEEGEFKIFSAEAREYYNGGYAPGQAFPYDGIGITYDDGLTMVAFVDNRGAFYASSAFHAPIMAVTGGYIIRSDARVKNILGVSDKAEDLRKIQALEITDYTMRNDKAETPKRHKMLIAQQVEGVYPQAISFDRGTVPDIMLPSQAVSFHEDEITVTLGQAHDIAVGDLVSLQVGEKGTLVEVVEVPSLATFVAKGWEGEPVSEVLVFGRMVDDLRSVNYDAISMLNVSATQELARRVEALEQAQERLAQVQAENSELRSQNERLMGLLEEMQQLREEVEGVRATCATQEEL